MLMQEIVPCVDNLGNAERALTFVNKNRALSPGKTRPENGLGRDFDIRTEMCNFAQILKCEHDT